MADNHGPYQQDPFTHIVEIHFPAGLITKLDFVGNRYMVRGVDQELEDVLGGPLPEYAAEQVGWRTSAGLDLRHLGSTYGELDGAKTAWLKNKVYPPTKEEPGALNEFLFADGTFVIEWDYGDVYTEINQFGGFPDGWDAYYSLFRSFDTYGEGHEWQVGTNEYVFGEDDGYHGQVGQWYWQFNEVSPFTFSATFRTEGTVTSDFGDALPPGPYSAQASPIDHLVHMTRVGSPNPEYGSYFGDVAQRDMLSTHASVGVYERRGQATFRSVGMEPRFYSDALVPITTNELPAPFSPPPDDPPFLVRNRLAMNIDGTMIAVSINGGLVKMVSGSSVLSFRTPENGTDGKPLLYFKEPLEEGTNPEEYFLPRWQVTMQIPGIIRCIWWYRLPKKKWDPPQTMQGVLGALSTVKPLTPPTAANWKTT